MSTKTLPTGLARLASHSLQFGYQEGGPDDGKVFLRRWNSGSIRNRDGHWYKINRDRVEWHGDGYCVVFEYFGTTDPEARDDARPATEPLPKSAVSREEP